MRRRYARVLALASLPALTTGCLSTVHRIPADELQRLALTPPEQRGARVRVVQGFAGEDQPPRAPEVQSSTTIVVVGGVHSDSGYRGGYDSGGRPHNLGKLKAEDNRVWLIAAAVAGLVLASSEGARYDGWVELHPMHPIHLYGPYGEHAWVPLAQLDAETAGWAQKAFVRPEEGPWRRLGRAPLDRVGWSYSILLGTSEIPGQDDSEKRGVLGHIQIGAFPQQSLGLLLDIGLGWGQDDVGASIADTRWAFELQALPVAAGILHGGLFGQAGLGQQLSDGRAADDLDLFVGGGALLQLELTTRLALTARAGVTQIYGATVSDLSVGLSIY
jgi:hypothetical protein